MTDTNSNPDYDEPLYGLQLMKSINDRKDAAHMPVRVAEKKFSSDYPKKRFWVLQYLLCLNNS